MAGFWSFDPPYLFDQVWLDGAFLSPVTTGGGIPPSEWAEVERPVELVRMAAGNHVAVRPLRGAKAPAARSALRFSVPFDLDVQADAHRIERAFHRASPVDFAYGLRVVDVFQATATNAYTLTRRRASASSLPGIDETSHPTVVELDEVETGSALTWTGAQTFTADQTGEIVVTYTPLFSVVFDPLAYSIADGNALNLDTLNLLEAIAGDFS